MTSIFKGSYHYFSLENNHYVPWNISYNHQDSRNLHQWWWECRLHSNRDIHLLFVGMHNHTAILKGDSVVSYKIQHITWFDKAYISGRWMGEFFLIIAKKNVLLIPKATFQWLYHWRRRHSIPSHTLPANTPSGMVGQCDPYLIMMKYSRT